MSIIFTETYGLTSVYQPPSLEDELKRVRDSLEQQEHQLKQTQHYHRLVAADLRKKLHRQQVGPLLAKKLEEGVGLMPHVPGYLAAESSRELLLEALKEYLINHEDD